MDYLRKLNANQLTAAQWNTGPLLVLAGPGSGKTATLTSRTARLVEESADESYRILCLTFTRKAASEMRERLFALVPDARNRALLTNFHSFAADILRQHGSHFGLSPEFEIIEDSERLALVKSLLTKRADEFTKFVSAEKALTALNFLFRSAIPDVNVPSLLKDSAMGQQLLALFSAYKELLKHQNCLDYDAILYFCEELLRERPRVAKQLQTVYRYICVDEFQDTNTVQYRILRALAPQRDSNIFIVGDDDQIIYQWNGASPARISELERHYDLKTIQLPENYRCPAEVVYLANALIAHNGDRAAGKKPLEAMRQLASTSPVVVKQFTDEVKEAGWVAEQIAQRIRVGAAPREIVVVARNTKLLERVGSALTTVNVESHVQRRKSQFESAPLRFVMAALKLAAVRSDNEIAAALIKALSDCRGIHIEPENLAAWAAQANGDYLEALALLLEQQSAEITSFCEAVQELMQGQYSDFLRRVFEYFDKLEDIELHTEGSEAFADYPAERDVWLGIIRDLGGESDAYALSLRQFLQEVALANKTPEAPSSAVRCLTIHACKGMEFSHVYLVGLAEDQLPSFQARKAGDDSREMQEERRNCFVAITRTMETLTLTYAGKYNGWQKAPSRFLKEMGFVVEGG
ncbi:ATP-dependent helicase [Nitrosovibrio sp. Nv4]|uniref:ATP-dependent helicase n=1 Tax=Nitrosovibrio sp. Nv4 TaxID=1945880 RepID=UPI000BD926E9|nr:ATP-dependent helicase [Nitrosovibrio sp. Nv4]SOD42738.1 DNA helicase-2 / ATP-dependent DNA helicase PcrA [Nitrosovibrio sp. Nv4]